MKLFLQIFLKLENRARDREKDGEIVALKRLRVQSSEEGMPLATVREIALLKQLERFDHPNIVRLLDVWYTWF